LLAAASAAAQFGPTPVQVAPVQEREVAAGQTFVGTVKPTRLSQVGSAVDGRVEEFPVNEGDRVKKGQVLARLRTTTLELECAAARAELEARRHELAELVNGTRPEEIAQAKARLAACEAKRRECRSKLRRTQDLYSTSRSAAEEQLQEASSACENAEQMYLDAQATLRMLEVGPRKERIEQARARLRAQDETVKRLDDLIALHTIKAPFDGFVAAEHCEVGQWLSKGATVVELLELDEVDVEVGVVEEAVVGLAPGAPARLEFAALNKTFTGRVVHIVPQANPRSRTFPVKVRVKNEVRGDVPLLKSNMLARVTLPVGRPEKALLVPKDAVVLGGPTPVVFVVNPDKADPTKATVAPVPVVLGVAVDNLIQVKGELPTGALVVTQGNERLMRGAPVILPGAKPAGAP
jgi:HlyD family secretion protein